MVELRKYSGGFAASVPHCMALRLLQGHCEPKPLAFSLALCAEICSLNVPYNASLRRMLQRMKTGRALENKEKPAISMDRGLPFYGGAEGNRTPVRKQLDRTFFGRSLLFTFPYRGVNKHTRRFGRVMMHGRGNSYPPHVRHSDHTQARFVALPGWMGA